MNFIDALRIWSAHLENYIGGRAEFWQAQGVIAATVKMYDALVPDWAQAPEDATHYVIHADNKAEWLRVVLPDKQVKPIENGGKWSYEHVWYSEHAGLVDLPIGLDWRLCIWERP